MNRLLARLEVTKEPAERARTRAQAAEAAQPEIREGKLLLTRVVMAGVRAVLKEIEQKYFGVLTKLFNVARFASQFDVPNNLDSIPDELNIEDEWILYEFLM